MRTIFDKSVLVIAGAFLFLPALASGTVFTLGVPATIAGSVVGNVTTIDFASLSYGIGANQVTYNGTVADPFIETYTFGGVGGTSTITVRAPTSLGGGLGGQVLWTITESPSTGLSQNNGSGSIEFALGDVTSVTFNSTFGSIFGFTSTTVTSKVTGGNYAYTYSSGSTPQFSTAVGTLTVTTPEPSTFGMLAIALMGGGILAYGKRRSLVHEKA